MSESRLSSSSYTAASNPAGLNRELLSSRLPVLWVTRSHARCTRLAQREGRTSARAATTSRAWPCRSFWSCPSFGHHHRHRSGSPVGQASSAAAAAVRQHDPDDQERRYEGENNPHGRDTTRVVVVVRWGLSRSGGPCRRATIHRRSRWLCAPSSAWRMDRPQSRPTRTKGAYVQPVERLSRDVQALSKG